jgi:hypothetical protein
MLRRDTFPSPQKSFTLAGRIFQLGLPVQVRDSYIKTELVLSVPNTHHLQDVFPKQNPVKFEFAQEKAHLLEGFQLGDEVTVRFTIAGREYVRDGQTLYFVVLLADDIYLTDEGPSYKEESPGGFAGGTIRLGDQMNTPGMEPPF